MAERSFRVNLQNDSTMTLTLSAVDLCHGTWTDGWNPPPAQIAPRETVGWQSESDGIWTGVEGYVIYNVERADGDQGQFKVHWDNPWYGVTQFTYPIPVSTVGGLAPTCDYEYNSPSGGSTFPTDPSTFSFHVDVQSFGYTEAGGEVTVPGDMVTGFLVGPVGGVAHLVGLLGIKKDPILDLRVADAEPSFIDLGPTSLREFTDATPKNWVGDWRSERVTVQISRVGYNKLSATIRDKTADPELDFSEEFSVGPDGLAHRLQDVPLTHLVGAGAAAGDEETSILFTRAARDVLHSGANIDSGKPWMALRFASAVSARAQDSAIPEPPADLTIRLGQALAGLVSSSRSHVRLSHGVGLTLYQVIQAGSVIGEQIGYQRLVAFQPAAEEQLVEYYQIT